MRPTHLIPILLLGLGATASLHASCGEVQSSRGGESAETGSNPLEEVWNQPRAPFRILGNTWYVGTAGLASLLIRGSAGAILIDTGLPQSGDLILQNLRRLGVEPSEIRLILTSHAHHDHVGALAQLKRVTGASVLASPASAAQLACGGRGDLHFGDASVYAPVDVDARLVDGEVVTLGDLRLTAHATPGHTPGSTSWSWVENHGDAEVNMVYADSLAAPGYRLVRNPDAPHVVEDFRRGFARVRELPCEVLITPHLDASALFARAERTPGAPDLIDAGACRAYADRAERTLDRQLKTQRSETD